MHKIFNRSDYLILLPKNLACEISEGDGRYWSSLNFIRILSTTSFLNFCELVISH